jgi:outer membrane protein TolC
MRCHAALPAAIIVLSLLDTGLFPAGLDAAAAALLLLQRPRIKAESPRVDAKSLRVGAARHGILPQGSRI